MRRRVAAAVLVAVLVACGGGDDGALRPVVGDIPPAIAAVEAERGGPQRYFEINATAQLVNLFVEDQATGDVVTYLYVDDQLQPPTPPRSVRPGAGTFIADDLVDDFAGLLSRVDEDLPSSDVDVLYVWGDGTGAVQYHLGVQSEQGGRLDVVVGPDGAVRAVDPDTAPTTTG